MKLPKYCFVLIAIFVICQATIAQGDSDKWIRLQTDNGEFSVDVPNTFSYFYNKDGFHVSKDSDDQLLSQASLLNAYRDETLVSFEVYRGTQYALEILIDMTTLKNSRERWSTLNGFKVKEVTTSNDRFHLVSYYFRSKESNYSVTVLSRKGPTGVAKRFLESVKFTPGSVQPAADATKLSDLPTTAVNLKSIGVLPYAPNVPPDKRSELGPLDKPLVIASRPRPSYIEGARHRNVTGTIQFRIEFSTNGYISNLELLKTLPEGLARQALFAALRIKYLPEIKEGKEISSTRILEYGFTIY
jgi:hypothetical protein